MGCGASSPNPKQPRRACHPLVTEAATPFLRVKASDAIKNNDVFLVEKILQEIPATENLGMSGDNSTCLHVAAQHNSFQAMKTLISWLKANKQDEMEQILEVTNSDGNTPVTICILNDASETFYVIMSENVIRRDYMTKNGTTLAELCQTYSPKCLIMLEGKTGQNAQIKNKEVEKDQKRVQEAKIQKQPIQPEQNQEKKKIDPVVPKEKEDQKEDIPKQPEQEKKIDPVVPKEQETQKEDIQKQPVNPEQEKEVENVVAKVEKVKIETDAELSALKAAKNKAIDSLLEGVPTGSKVYKLLRSLVEKDTHFQDPDFPAQLSSISTESNNKYQDDFQTAKWKRPNELFDCDFDKIFVFDNIEANDIAQGILGVCYFLASLSALTEFPSRLTKMFLNKTANKYGAYGLQFYVRGVPTEIVIDDTIPCFGDRKNQPLFSKPKGNELWVLLAEKAWAKLFKNYTNCESGIMDEALEYMMGVPTILYRTKEQNVEEIFKILSEGDAAKHILCAATGSTAEKDKGLVSDHAYTIMSVHAVGKYKLVKLRNPWGKFEWNGDFSDKSSLWTEELKVKVGYANADDGVFCMKVEDFKKYFDNYTVTIYNDGWDYSYCEAESGNGHAEYFKFTVDEPCEAYFRIHQKNKRFLSEEEQKSFKYSPGELIIARVEEDGTYKPIVENSDEIDTSSIFGDRSIFPCKQLKLNLKVPGEYVIRTKMKWTTTQRDQFTLSAYSSKKLQIKQVKPIKDFLPMFYQNLGKSAPKKTMTEGCEMANGFYSNHLYLHMKNSTDQTWKITIKFTKLINLRLPKPHNTPENTLPIEVPPGKSVTTYLKKIESGGTTSYGWSMSQKLV